MTTPAGRSDSAQFTPPVGNREPESGLVPTWAFTSLAAAAGFLTYSCVYAVRKPFDAVTLHGETFLDSGLDLKTACVLGQILGYAVSKYTGAWLCSAAPDRYRAALLAGCVVAAETALVVFALAPNGLKPFAMFVNGLPLGMIWGLIVRYLEGRRVSDLLLVSMSVSFILSGAVTKDVGLFLMAEGVSEEWMPAVTGAIFLPFYLIGVLILNRLPQPTVADVADRSARVTMTAATRWAFLQRVGLGLGLLLAAYLMLTVYRDYRDYYGREIFLELQEPTTVGQFTRMDRLAVGGVLVALLTLSRVKSHRRAVAAVFVFMLGGFALIGGATIGFQAGRISGPTWMALVGLGLYWAYIPFGVVLFERLVAATRFPGTSVFVIQLADGIGYTGSAAIQVYRDLVHAGTGRLDFFVTLSYAVAVVGGVLVAVGGVAVWRRAFTQTGNAHHSTGELKCPGSIPLRPAPWPVRSLWPRTQISGTVRYKKAPLPYAMIIFLAEDNRSYTATAGPDGRYTLPGVPQGRVRVAVQVPGAAVPIGKGERGAKVDTKSDDDHVKGKKDESPPTYPDLPFDKYLDPAKSGLVLELTGPEQNYDIDLN